MAGVIPKRATSGRKQWNVYVPDGPKSSLKRLRSQLASDGCPESQVVLAKQLLDEHCEHDSDAKENARVGVYWLIKASEQGNSEATTLLRTCLQTGKGISELNYLDVKACISMTQDEKLARKAAREMFASLSNGGEYITSDQLQKKILSINRDQPSTSTIQNNQANGDVDRELLYDTESDEDTDWSQKSEITNEKLTEDHLVSAAVNYSHGYLPVVNNIMCLSEPDVRALDHIPLMQRSVLHPLLALKIIYFKLMKLLSKQFSSFLFAKSEWHLFIFMLIYVIISSQNALFIVPLFLYLATFIVMVIATFQMLQNRRDFNDFRLWSGLFICYSRGGLNSEEAEYQYIRNNLKPYGWFFLALTVNLVVYPTVVEDWIPQSELMIMSFCLTFMTLLGFMPKGRHAKTLSNIIVLFSFGINVMAKYPYETDPVVAQGWRFLELKIPTFASYVIGNGIEFCINFRILLYACTPFLFIKMASERNWKGTFDTLIPHCVTLTWLQMCIISSKGATMFGLLRSSLALVGTVLFLPLVGLTSIFLPAAALTKWIVTSNVAFKLISFVAMTALGFVLCRFFAQTRYKKLVAIIQIFSTFIAAFSLLKTVYQNQNHYYSSSKLPEYLSWEVYQRFCHQPVWQEENVAMAQIKCAELQNSVINWDGYINDIKIKSISNMWQSLIEKIPSAFVQQQLYCIFGEKVTNDCGNFPELVRDECNLFYNAVKVVSQCSLRKYNVYSYELTVRMHSGIWGKSPEVGIFVDDFFTNFTLRLKPNDHVWFKGTLFNNEASPDGILGGPKTHVSLEEIHCVACADGKLTNEKKNVQAHYINNVKDDLMLGFKFILNAVFYPLVVFK